MPRVLIRAQSLPLPAPAGELDTAGGSFVGSDSSVPSSLPLTVSSSPPALGDGTSSDSDAAIAVDTPDEDAFALDVVDSAVMPKQSMAGRDRKAGRAAQQLPTPPHAAALDLTIPCPFATPVRAADISSPWLSGSDRTASAPDSGASSGGESPLLLSAERAPPAQTKLGPRAIASLLQALPESPRVRAVPHALEAMPALEQVRPASAIPQLPAAASLLLSSVRTAELPLPLPSMPERTQQTALSSTVFTTPPATPSRAPRTPLRSLMTMPAAGLSLSSLASPHLSAVPVSSLSTLPSPLRLSGAALTVHRSPWRGAAERAKMRVRACRTSAVEPPVEETKPKRASKQQAAKRKALTYEAEAAPEPRAMAKRARQPPQAPSSTYLQDELDALSSVDDLRAFAQRLIDSMQTQYA